MPLLDGFGVGAGLAFCAFTQTATSKRKTTTALNRKVFVGNIDLEDLSARGIWTRRDTEYESGGRNSGGEKLRRQREDGVENVAVALLPFGTIVL
jgi:hypothetical protein